MAKHIRLQLHHQLPKLSYCALIVQTRLLQRVDLALEVSYLSFLRFEVLLKCFLRLDVILLKLIRELLEGFEVFDRYPHFFDFLEHKEVLV